MYMHNKRLQYTVRVSEPNPLLACRILEQFGGPMGELATAMTYCTQANFEDDADRRELLHVAADERLNHLEAIGSMVSMLNRGAHGPAAPGTAEQAELYVAFNRGDSHRTTVLHGAAAVPWSETYDDTMNARSASLRSNIAAARRARGAYQRLMGGTDDPGVREALGFLMTRAIAHQRAFEQALRTVEPTAGALSRPQPSGLTH